MSADAVFLGLDIGTSGVRGCAINVDGEELASHRVALPPATLRANRIEQDALIWQQAAHEVIRHLAGELRPRSIAALAIDGTSGTVLVCDEQGQPLSPALMYNDQSCTAEAAQVAQIAPAECGAHGASASLAKAMYLLRQHPEARHICHQADWVAATLTGRYGVSDENNCLKLGYNSLEESWNKWLNKLGLSAQLLPDVQPPGSRIGRILPDVAEPLGLPENCQIIAGTTDSIAAFIATGAHKIGDAVTSLGSTLVLKIITEQPVFAAEFGIYSHRLGGHWLAGGASNSGGAVLSQYFSQSQLDAMTPQLNPARPTGLNYYPLPATGERFPRHDPGLKPQLEPRPDDDVSFFQAMLEGIARIEAEGYRQLAKLGAPAPHRVFTAGGGSHNPAWRQIRERALNIPVLVAEHSEASYGSALLARQGYLNAINSVDETQL